MLTRHARWKRWGLVLNPSRQHWEWLLTKTWNLMKRIHCLKRSRKKLAIVMSQWTTPTQSIQSSPYNEGNIERKKKKNDKL